MKKYITKNTPQEVLFRNKDGVIVRMMLADIVGPFDAPQKRRRQIRPNERVMHELGIDDYRTKFSLLSERPSTNVSDLESSNR